MFVAGSNRGGRRRIPTLAATLLIGSLIWLGAFSRGRQVADREYQAPPHGPRVADIQIGVDTLVLVNDAAIFRAQLPSGGPSAPPVEITGAEADSTGVLYVLDGRRAVVWRFDRRGVLRDSLGTLGHGKGQMFFPSALAIDGVAHAFVLDLGNQRVDGFRRSRGSWTSASVPVPHASSGLCVLDSALVTFGGKADSLLRVIGMDGVVLANIGSPYSREGMLEETFAAGYLVCVKRTGQVVVLPSGLPEIRAYSLASGRLLWSSPIPGYRSQQVNLTGKRVTITAPPGGFTQAQSAHVISPGVLVVQLAFLPPRQGDTDQHRLTTQYFRLKDGKYLGQQFDVPAIVAASASRVFLVDPQDSLQIVTRAYRFRE